MVKLVRNVMEIKGRWLFVRGFCTRRKEPTYTLEYLKDRSLILVSGKDGFGLLQKLVTNDLSKLDNANKSIFSIFLNNKGKVLHDTIIYKNGEDYLVEVDNKALQPVKIHLKLFKEGRRVQVRNLEDKLSIWSVMTDGEKELEKLKQVDLGSEWIVSMDPRLEELGLRVIGDKKSDVMTALRNIGLTVSRTQRAHQVLRYKLGVAQGLTEIPLGRCNPLEINADFLSGLCPKKSNYNGCNSKQNSASFSRRVFPLEFVEDVEDDLPLNSPIQDYRGKKKSPIGYLCGLKKKFGLGLITVKEGLTNTQVVIVNKEVNVSAQCTKPSWWPHHLATSS